MPILIVSKLLHSRVFHFTLNIINHFVMNHTVVNVRHSEHYNVSVYCYILSVSVLVTQLFAAHARTHNRNLIPGDDSNKLFKLILSFHLTRTFH